MFEDTDILAALWLYTFGSPRKHLEVIFDIPSNRFTVSLWQFPSKIQDRVYLYIPNEIGSVRKIDLFLFRDFVVVIRE